MFGLQFLDFGQVYGSFFNLNPFDLNSSQVWRLEELVCLLVDDLPVGNKEVFNILNLMTMMMVDDDNIWWYMISMIIYI